jgi:hypothetical protein
MLKYALRYAEIGLAVFPLAPRGKTPLTKNGVKDATKNVEAIRAWWTLTPDANIGIAVQYPYFVIDIDSQEALIMLKHQDRELPTTVTARTAKGLHFWYATKQSVKNKVGLLPGVDIRAGGGYVVAPPSIHPSGVEYEWDVPPKGGEGFSEAPAWVLELLAEPEVEAPRVDVEKVLGGVGEGERDNELFRYACRLRAKNLTEGEAETLVATAAEKCTPPFPTEEAMRKVKQAWQYRPGSIELMQQLEQKDKEEVEMPEPGGRFEIFSIEQLMASTYKPPLWLIPGLIPEGFTMIAASPKIGKTIFATNLCEAVATGGRILNHWPVNKGEALYIDQEQTPWKSKNRIELIQQRRGVNFPKMGITLAFDWPLFDEHEKGLERLDTWLGKHPNCTVAVIDVIGKVKGELPGSGNAYEKEYKWYSKVKQVFDWHRVAGIAIHHDTKSQEGDMIDRISGSRAATGAADVVITLSRKRGQKEGTLYATGRDIEEVQQAMLFDGQGLQWILDPNAGQPQEENYYEPHDSDALPT